jgi:hypothetical protein
MPDEEFENFWRGHQMAMAISRVAMSFLDELDHAGFQREMRRVYEEHCVLPDLPRKPRPSLRLVMNGD